jgi:hypothetical protein
MHARFELEVDPQGVLPPEQRAKFVKAAARAHSARLHAAKALKRTQAA